MIVCGWCLHPTEPDRCRACGHVDPARPWIQRAEAVPVVQPETGRPILDRRDIRRRLAEVRAELGPRATVETIAERLEVSPRTVRRWQQMAD